MTRWTDRPPTTWPVEEERTSLEEPLGSGYAFFLQTGWDDGSLDETMDWLREK